MKEQAMPAGLDRTVCYGGPYYADRKTLRPLPMSPYVRKCGRKVVEYGGEFDCLFADGLVYEDTGFSFSGDSEVDIYIAQKCRYELPEHIVPYSIRSFLLQMAQAENSACRFHHEVRGSDPFGNLVFEDSCCKEHCYKGEHSECSVIRGDFAEASCPAFGEIRNLCDSPLEFEVLKEYFTANKAVEAPMLVPQAWQEIAVYGEPERFRVDFQLFAPRPGGSYQKVVIEINSWTYHEERSSLLRDAKRGRRLTALGNAVIAFWADELKDKAGPYYAVQDIRAIAGLQGGLT